MNASIVMLIFIFMICASIYMRVRIHFVFKYIKNLLKEVGKKHDPSYIYYRKVVLASYNRMLFEFWVWPLSKMLKLDDILVKKESLRKN